MRRAILATGGMDSTVLIYKSLAEGVVPQIITVNYGHEAFAKQFEMLQWHIRELHLPELIILHVAYNTDTTKPGLFKPGYKLTDTSDTDPDKLFASQDMRYGEMFIEGRNLIMLANALAYCSANRIDEIQVGYLYSAEEWVNRRSYKLLTGDNSPQFVDMMNLLTLTGFTHQMRIRAPFYEERMGKKEVVTMGKELGVDFKHTHSCYWSEPCGLCDNCLLRQLVL